MTLNLNLYIYTRIQLHYIHIYICTYNMYNIMCFSSFFFLRYVGEGRGEYDKRMITTYSGYQLRPWGRDLKGDLDVEALVKAQGNVSAPKIGVQPSKRREKNEVYCLCLLPLLALGAYFLLRQPPAADDPTPDCDTGRSAQLHI